MRIMSHYDRGFRHGYRQGRLEVAQAALHTATSAHAATDAGRIWLDELADHARQLLHGTAEAAPPRQVAHLRTPFAQIRAATGHLATADARVAARGHGIADGRTAAVGPTVRDLYLTATQALGAGPGLAPRPGMSPSVDGTPADRWLETTRLGWLEVAARGDPPLPGTAAAMAHLTLTGGATPARGRAPVGPTGAAATVSGQRASRPAPSTTPATRQPATAPPPAHGGARVARRPAPPR